MRKVKQVDRPYLIFRYGDVGRTLYDSHQTFAAARATVDVRVRSHPRERLEVYEGGRLLFRFDGSQTCKNTSNAAVGQTGECLRCGADQGEACR